MDEVDAVEAAEDDVAVRAWAVADFSGATCLAPLCFFLRLSTQLTKATFRRRTAVAQVATASTAQIETSRLVASSPEKTKIS